MPFKSEKQRRYLWANEPKIARDWTDKYGSQPKNKGGVIEPRMGLRSRFLNKGGKVNAKSR